MSAEEEDVFEEEGSVELFFRLSVTRDLSERLCLWVAVDEGQRGWSLSGGAAAAAAAPFVLVSGVMDGTQNDGREPLPAWDSQ